MSLSACHIACLSVCLPACLPAAKDVPGGNDIGPVLHDEELFATVGW
jgi:xanthine dehydrogenase molybdopterin-binding subunit B